MRYSILEDYIMNKIKNYTLVMLIQGYMQMGKSTLVWYLMNCLSMKLFGVAWDFKKYCARNIEEFIDMIDKYDNKLIVYEEASKDISIDKWYDNINHFFNIIMQTQAYKHNLICLVFPHSSAVSSRQKYFIKLGLEITERIDEDEIHATVFRPTIYTRNFWRLDDNDLKYKWWGTCFVKYTQADLEASKEYTKWLELMKQDTLNDIKRKLVRHNKQEKIKEIEDIDINSIPAIKAPKYHGDT